MKRTILAVLCVAIVCGPLAGCGKTSSYFNVDDAKVAWCEHFRVTVKSWIPESAGGSAPMNELPSDGDIQHQAIQMASDAPIDLITSAKKVADDTLSQDSVAILADADTVLNTCHADLDGSS